MTFLLIYGALILKLFDCLELKGEITTHEDFHVTFVGRANCAY